VRALAQSRGDGHRLTGDIRKGIKRVQ